MNNFELINGSWQQTLASILYDIYQKLDDTEIDDIIRSIDDRISDEEILDLLGIILNKINLLKTDSVDINNNIILLSSIVSNILLNTMSLKTDNVNIKNNIVTLSGIVSNILLNIISLKTDVNTIMNRVNGLSVVNKITIMQRQPVRDRVIKHRECRGPIELPKKIEDITFLIDMELREGHSDGYKIYIPGGYTYDSRLSWLINGNKRRLFYMGELTDDILDIYRSYNIIDIEVIKKSRLNTYEYR